MPAVVSKDSVDLAIKKDVVRCVARCNGRFLKFAQAYEIGEALDKFSMGGICLAESITWIDYFSVTGRSPINPATHNDKQNFLANSFNLQLSIKGRAENATEWLRQQGCTRSWGTGDGQAPSNAIEKLQPVDKLDIACFPFSGQLALVLFHDMNPDNTSTGNGHTICAWLADGKDPLVSKSGRETGRSIVFDPNFGEFSLQNRGDARQFMKMLAKAVYDTYPRFELHMYKTRGQQTEESKAAKGGKLFHMPFKF